MEDKKFDEIMEKYVSSTINNRENDLKGVKEYTPKHRQGFALKWGAVAVSICIIMSISILLPNILIDSNKKSSIQSADSALTGDEVYNEQIYQEQVEGFDVLLSYGLSDCLLPDVSSYMPDVYILRKLDNKNTVVGLEADCSILDSRFKKITIGSILKQYNLQKYSCFSICINDSMWNDFTIKWSDYHDQNNQEFITKIVFSDEKYNYYIEAVTYEQIEPVAILNYVY